MKRIPLFLGAALGLFVAVPAFAQHPQSMRELDAQLHRQSERIQRGIDRGALTRDEAHYLQREQNRLFRMQQRARADRHISPHEWHRLSAAADAQDQRIRHEMRDGERAYSGYRDYSRGYRG